MAFLEKIEIEHFRGFFEKQSLSFATPSGKNGSGLTLVVGPNNTGKTTLLEAMLFGTSKKFRGTERHDKNPPKIIIKSDIGGSLFTNLHDGSEVSEQAIQQDEEDSKSKENPQMHSIRFELIPSRRHWNPYSSGYWQTDQLIQQSTGQSVRNSGELDIAAVLKQINRDSGQKAKFNQYLKEIIPHFTDWTIDSDNRDDYVRYQTETASHIVNLSGDGIISVFRICAHLVADSKDTVLIIDEPELSLHPSAQKSLATVLSKASANKQVIVCTHSPYFANWGDYLKGAKFARLNKPEDKQCEISFLDTRKQYSNFINNNHMDAWQKPQLLDIAAKEILFADKILFVEGQEDVGLIKKWFNDNNKQAKFEIFGYGVGSYSNMKLFLEMAKDLSLPKVAALYDMGVESKAAYDADQKEYTDYKFEILPTEDIRDKEKQVSGQKKMIEGCFNGSGDLKADKKADFEKIMQNIIEYFE